MSATAIVARAVAGVRRAAVEGGSVALAAVLLVWSLLPIYNMALIALDPADGNVEFNGDLWPWAPSLNSFVRVVSGADGVFEEFWQAFGNSLYMGVATMVLTVLIGSLTAFAIGRLRLRHGSLLSNAALLTYLIPASFLAIAFHRTMQLYGFADNLWAVIAAQVDLRDPVRDPGAAAEREIAAARARRSGSGRWRVGGAGLLAHLRAAAGAGAGGRRDVRAAARLERLPLPVPASVLIGRRDSWPSGSPSISTATRSPGTI